jgi:biopolymer transport protein ExbD
MLIKVKTVLCLVLTLMLFCLSAPVLAVGTLYPLTPTDAIETPENQKTVLVFIIDNNTYTVNGELIEMDVSCFLQTQIPHFCKTFSPGTGGEFLC